MKQHRKLSLQLRRHEDGINSSKPSRKLSHTKGKTDRYDRVSVNESHADSNIDKQIQAVSSAVLLRNKDKKIDQKIQKQMGVNTSYKERIVKQRRAYSFINNKIKEIPKNRNYSILCHNRKTENENALIYSKSANNNSPDIIALKFASQCFQLYDSYKQHSGKGEYDEALQKLVCLLNYTVDINNRAYFFKVLHCMCQFYETLQLHAMAFKVYYELRQAAVQQKQYEYLIISLIGMAHCAAGVNLMKESIILLKKALQYSWYINKADMELNIYDQLGEKYCKKGQVARATEFHYKFSNSITEAAESRLKQLSKQQIEHLQNENITMQYNNLSGLFLAHFDLPFKSTTTLPALDADNKTPRAKMTDNVKYYDEPYEIDLQVRRVLKNWMFKSETAEPSLQNARGSDDLFSSKKYAYIQIKFSRQMKEKGYKFQTKANFIANQQTTEVKKKMTLDEQIRKFTNEPGLEKEWFQKMVKRVLNDQKRKLSQVNDPVRMTKIHNKTKAKNEILKLIFKHFIEFMSTHKIYNGPQMNDQNH